MRNTQQNATAAPGDAMAILKLPEPELIGILRDPQATLFAKAKACQRLAVIGTKEAVPALAALLDDAKLAHYGRFGLEPMPDREAGKALRDALGKLDGPLLVGVINSIGQRRDAKAVGELARLLRRQDGAVAQAAAAALGKIGNLNAAKQLRQALRRTDGAVREAVAHACLACAERLSETGKRRQAQALYRQLQGANAGSLVQEAAARGAGPARR